MARGLRVAAALLALTLTALVSGCAVETSAPRNEDLFVQDAARLAGATTPATAEQRATVIASGDELCAAARGHSDQEVIDQLTEGLTDPLQIAQTRTLAASALQNLCGRVADQPTPVKVWNFTWSWWGGLVILGLIALVSFTYGAGQSMGSRVRARRVEGADAG